MGSALQLYSSWLGCLLFINVKGLLQPSVPSLDFCATGMHNIRIQMISTDFRGPLKILGVILNNLKPRYCFPLVKKRQHSSTNGPQNPKNLILVSMKLKPVESFQSSHKFKLSQMFTAF